MPSTSTLGVARSIEPRSDRSSSSSERQSAQPSTCASTRARVGASSRSCNRSGNRSRTSAFGQSLIEKLLHSAHRVVVVHPGGPFRRAHRLGDFLVRQSFSYSKRKDLLLRRRQAFDRPSHSQLGLVGHDVVERVVLGRRIVFLDLDAIATSLL